MRRVWPILFFLLAVSGVRSDDVSAPGKSMRLPTGKAPQGFTPFYQDQYSGKTISGIEMAADMVLNRFFNAPAYGTKAPDFVLSDAETSETVFLEDLHVEKPVVLFFGSFGCDVMRDGIEDLLAVYERYKNDFNFVMIYIREAHSLNGFGKDRARVEDPTNYQERRAVAKQCQKTVQIPFRILLDTIDDRVSTRWAAWPIRLYVVDTRGTVIYAGKPGPWGFSPGNGFKAERAEQLRDHADRFSQNSLEEFMQEYLESKD